LALPMGDTVLGEKLKAPVRRLLASFFSPPTTFRKGEKIIRERQLAGGLVIVLSGVLEERTDHVESLLVGKPHTTGMAVGEMGLLQGIPDTCACILVRQHNAFVASEEASVTVLSFERLMDFNAQYPKMAQTLFRRAIRNLHGRMDQKVYYVYH